MSDKLYIKIIPVIVSMINSETSVLCSLAVFDVYVIFCRFKQMDTFKYFIYNN